ncbi:hypothetical protein [Fulvivirga sedimenti]|uniref:Uncharacterized protein n=1 Tax=Fulvivirga sedimenti TaxID=2879465 RepID=A0A9X1HV60_9BACT|nr:hypothetical protein [Fulvivirga sedimenti]MCA6078853.1 hypothetical protein [Fulvivirga sedimenti]
MKLIIAILFFVAMTVAPNAENSTTIATDNIAHFTVNENFAFGDNYLLDIDRDGKSDFSFTTASIYNEGAVYNKYMIHALQNHEILNAAEHAAVLENNEVIGTDMDASIHWTSGAGQIIEQIITNEGTNWFGTWSGGRSQYVGIKVNKNGNAYYGWVEIIVDPATEQAYVVDYAINRTPNTSISAGQF